MSRKTGCLRADAATIASAYTYATTIHSAQGITADRAIIDANMTSRTTAKDVYYVAISRARHSAEVFTNSIKALPDAVSRVSEKAAALDLLSRAGDRRRRAEPGIGGRGTARNRPANELAGGEAGDRQRTQPARERSSGRG